MSERAPLTRREARELERRPRSRRAGRRHPAPVRRRGPRRAFSLLTFLAVGALMVGTTVPINALMPETASVVNAASAPAPATATRVQSMAVGDEATIANAPRDGFTVLSYQDQVRAQYGARSVAVFTPTTGAVRWPFPYSVPISDYWGPRDAPCEGCSTFHKGVDFTPGSGAPIYAIADGVVVLHEDTFGGLGNNIWIDHVINGQKITSVSAHMITGSSTLVAGDIVRVGDFLGLVGDTGSSVGAHLHFELLVQGVHVDPFEWLTANTVN